MKYKVTGTRLALREKPSTDAAVLLRMETGTEVIGDQHNAEWVKLSYGGKTGYSMLKFLQAVAVEESDAHEDAEPAGTQTGANEGVQTVNITLNTLRDGSKGNQVKTVQRLLEALGYDCGTADGIIGDKTLAAVKKFQKAKGLDADGVVGKNTWSALLK